jgi:dihydrolipoamide dehydrogenase
MTTGTKYDLIVLGSGPAGHAAAITARSKGMKVCVVELDPGSFGGVCLNEGCIPAKAILHSAFKIRSVISEPVLYGKGTDSINMHAIMRKGTDARVRLKKGLRYVFDKEGITTVYGKGTYRGGRELEVTDAEGSCTAMPFNNLVIATGSRPRKLRGLEPDGKKILSSSDVLCLSELPEDILIVGAGAIGVEFSSFFSSLGVKVTLLEARERMLPSEDIDVSARMASVFRKQGTKFIPGAEVKDVSGVQDNKIKVLIEKNGGVSESSFEKVLVAAGRVPASDRGISEDAGIETDEEGFIKTGKDYMTSISGVYAAGDVIRGPMLAHAASAEGEKCAMAAAGEKIDPVDQDCVPSAVYSRIEAAGIGLRETDRGKLPENVRISKYFFAANGRAVATGQTDGMVKLLTDREGRIAGAHIVGPRATEIIHEFVLAKKAGLTAEDIADTIHAHPTFSEAVREVCAGLRKKN